MSDEPKKAVTFYVTLTDGPETQIAGKPIAPADYVFLPPYELQGLGAGSGPESNNLSQIIILNDRYARQLYRVGLGFTVPGHEGLNEASRRDNQKPQNERREFALITAFIRLIETDQLKKHDQIEAFLNDAEKYLNGELPANWPEQLVWRTLPEQWRGKIDPGEIFAFPALPVMFIFMPMFAGKPDRIPRRIFTTDYKNLIGNDKEQAEYILDSLTGEIRQDIGENGQVIDTQYYIVSDNPKIEAFAYLDQTLFQNDLGEKERALGRYIKKAFGPEGLRHFLALIIGLDENYRQGYFEWSINDHLKRLGIKKDKSRKYEKEAREIATNIVKVFCSFMITAQQKRGKQEKITGKKLFNIDGYKIELFDKKIIDGSLTIRATDFWYKQAFLGMGQKDGPKYTKLLKKIATVRHSRHPYVIYLAPLLAISWRMSPERKWSVKNLMEQCELDYKGRKRTEHLKELESQFDYMIKHGYLGDWENSGENKYPSKCQNRLIAF